MGNRNTTQEVCRNAIACAVIALSLCLTFATGCTSKTFTDAFVSIAPGNQMDGTGSTFFVLAEASPTGVTWSLSGGSACSGAACGTLTNPTPTSVTYIAPVTIPGATMNVTITATSTTDTKVSASEVLTIFPVYVQITGPTNPVVVPLTSANLSAVVVGDPTKAGVTWSISGPCSSTLQGCGSFRSTSPTQTTFVAPAATTLETITITATSITDPNESASFQVTVPKLAVYVFSPTILPTALAGQPYSASITIVGNTPPYTITPSNVPTWATVTIGVDSVTIAGTPPAGTQGTVYTQINVADSTTPVPLQSSQSFAITTYPAAATGNNLLKGSYTFYATGWTDGTAVGTTLNGIAYIGSFTADGNGNITGGELDVNSPSVGLTSYASLSGSYNIQYGSGITASQTGLITLIPSGKPPLPITLAVTLGGIQSGATAATDLATRGNIVEFDDTTGIAANPTANSSGIRASGPLMLQSPSVLSSTASPFTGSYAFAMAGNGPVSLVNLACYGGSTTKNCGPISLAGAMTFGSGGVITTGEEDVMMQEVSNAAVMFTGSMANSGNTDANGRVVTTIKAASTAAMLNWPSDFVVYAINPTTFYIMSTDSYATNSLITGTAMQQNLADIAATPFSAAQPIVLYGNLTSTTSFSQTNGPNGQLRVELMLLTPSPTSATAGKLAGTQWVNASGTYTATSTPGTVSSYTYTVAPNGRVPVSSTGQPLMYLVDTNTGFGTQFASGAAPGIFTFVPQTATTLNSGTYSFAGYNNTSQLAPQEVGTLIIPSGGVPSTGSIVSVTGYDYTAFGAVGNVYVAGEPILYNGSFTGTLSETAGVFAHGVSPVVSGIIFNFAPSLSTGYFQGCGQATPEGGGFVISPTSFLCVPAGGSFGVIHLFQQ